MPQCRTVAEAVMWRDLLMQQHSILMWLRVLILPLYLLAVARCSFNGWRCNGWP